MDSLSQECTASKHRYDQCFNAWFEGYLKPIVAAQPGEEEEEELEGEEQEEEDSSYLETFEDDEEELASEGMQSDLLSEASSSGAGGVTHLTTHHQHHHPAWSLRHEDRHPDLWPFSTRPAGGRLSRATKAAAVASAPPQLEEKPQESPAGQIDAPMDVPAIINPAIASKTPSREAPTAVTLTVSSSAEQRAEWAKAKKEEYDRNCGDLWTDYRECLRRAIDANHPLSTLLAQARMENPIENAEAYEGGGYGAPGAQP
ncbi:hypothetical protein NliqN6_1146 [Naganishia liquefaciens]|uniref:Uncharacterized protein n=1 Tax=Naganishia liquefaciens TaxID=104408 RepID=A0A8H3YCY2_9TREE|nr:hypothetical protein NliqN6_1146 [Naganishia liquefaciens]